MCSGNKVERLLFEKGITMMLSLLNPFGLPSSFPVDVDNGKLRVAIGDRSHSRFPARSAEEDVTTTINPNIRSRSSRQRSLGPRRIQPVQSEEKTPSPPIDSTKPELTVVRKSRFRATTEKIISTTHQGEKIETTEKPDAAHFRRRNSRTRIESRTLSNDEKLHTPEPEVLRNRKEEESPEISQENWSSRRSPSRGSRALPSGETFDDGKTAVLPTSGETKTRLERKVQKVYSSGELRSRVRTSGRFSGRSVEEISRNQKSEDGGLRAESNGRIGSVVEPIAERRQDSAIALESVRINMKADASEVVVVSETPEVARSSPQRPSRDRRPKSRDSLEITTVPSGSSRRGSSRFQETTTDSSERSTTLRSRGENRNSRERTRSPEVKKSSDARTRSRGRATTVSSLGVTEPPEVKPKTVEGRSRGNLREARVLDQETRGRSRIRVRPEVTTPASSEGTTTFIPETTSSAPVLTSAPETFSTFRPLVLEEISTTGAPSTIITTSTSSSRGRGRIHPKTLDLQARANTQREDFFNHGLGFRGRKYSTSATTVPSVNLETANEARRSNESSNSSNLGWTLRRRHHATKKDVGSRSTVATWIDEQNNEISNETTTTNSTPTRSTSNPKTDDVTTTTESTTKARLRGNRNFDKGSGSTASSKSHKENEESDNYPPEFKARLSQLIGNLSFQKIPVPKSTPRIPVEYLERLKKLLVHPVKTTTKPKSEDLETSASGYVLPLELPLISVFTPLTPSGPPHVRKSYIRKQMHSFLSTETNRGEIPEVDRSRKCWRWTYSEYRMCLTVSFSQHIDLITHYKSRKDVICFCKMMRVIDLSVVECVRMVEACNEPAGLVDRLFSALLPAPFRLEEIRALSYLENSHVSSASRSENSIETQNSLKTTLPTPTGQSLSILLQTFGKKSAAALFAERSRMKLEQAKKLIKPDLNAEENGVEITTVIFEGPEPIVNENKKESGKGDPQNAGVRSNWKLSRSRKGIDDNKPRSLNLSTNNGKVKTETVTSSSDVEGRSRFVPVTRVYGSSVSRRVKTPRLASTTESQDRSDRTEETSPSSKPKYHRPVSRYAKPRKIENIAKPKKSEGYSRVSRVDFPRSQGPIEEEIATLKSVKSYVSMIKGLKISEEEALSKKSRGSKTYGDSITTTSTQTDDTTLSPNDLESLPRSNLRRSNGTSNRKDAEEKGKDYVSITKKPKSYNSASKTVVRSRYINKNKRKLENGRVDGEDNLKSVTPGPTNRYSRRKNQIFKPFEKSERRYNETSGIFVHRQDFRSRTSTYRRHSDGSTVVPEVQSRITGLPQSPLIVRTSSSTPQPTVVPYVLLNTHTTQSALVPKVSTESTPLPVSTVRSEISTNNIGIAEVTTKHPILLRPTWIPEIPTQYIDVSQSPLIPEVSPRYSVVTQSPFLPEVSMTNTEVTGTILLPEVSTSTSVVTQTTSVPEVRLKDADGVAITPRNQRLFHATIKSAVPQSVTQEPVVSLQISNDSSTSQQQASGIIDSSNGDSGNSNIFNPTRSLFLNGNSTLLEQLRSTVAPLLENLATKTPVFAGTYKNVNSANSASRITPNGSPPRFSARYRGAELFLRRPTPGGYQPTVPTVIRSSSTTFPSVENSGSPSLIDISSPGEPKFLTFYHALESASIKNEQPGLVPTSQGPMLTQVENNATNIESKLNNDTTSPTVPFSNNTTENTVTLLDTALSSDLFGGSPTTLTRKNQLDETQEISPTPETLDAVIAKSLNDADTTTLRAEPIIRENDNSKISISTTMDSIEELVTKPTAETDMESGTKSSSSSTSESKPEADISSVLEFSVNETTVQSTIDTKSNDEVSSALESSSDTSTKTVTLKLQSSTVASSEMPEAITISYGKKIALDEMMKDEITVSNLSKESYSPSTTAENLQVVTETAEFLDGTTVETSGPTIVSTNEVENNATSEFNEVPVTTEGFIETSSFLNNDNFESNVISELDDSGFRSPTVIPALAAVTESTTLESTTEAFVGSTTRSKLIDFAEDILNRLEATIGESTEPTKIQQVTEWRTAKTTSSPNFTNNIDISKEAVIKSARNETTSLWLNGTHATNDTLLKELMSIAKTLLSEAMNDTTELPLGDDNFSAGIGREGDVSLTDTAEMNMTLEPVKMVNDEVMPDLVETVETSTNDFSSENEIEPTKPSSRQSEGEGQIADPKSISVKDENVFIVTAISIPSTDGTTQFQPRNTESSSDAVTELISRSGFKAEGTTRQSIVTTMQSRDLSVSVSPDIKLEASTEAPTQTTPITTQSDLESNENPTTTQFTFGTNENPTTTQFGLESTENPTTFFTPMENSVNNEWSTVEMELTTTNVISTQTEIPVASLTKESMKTIINRVPDELTIINSSKKNTPSLISSSTEQTTKPAPQDPTSTTLNSTNNIIRSEFNTDSTINVIQPRLKVESIPKINEPFDNANPETTSTPGSPESTTDPETKTATVARLQDATLPTAQRTAGSGTTNSDEIIESTTLSQPPLTTPPVQLTESLPTISPKSQNADTIMTVTRTTTLLVGRIPVTPMDELSSTEVPTTVDPNENLIFMDETTPEVTTEMFEDSRSDITLVPTIQADTTEPTTITVGPATSTSTVPITTSGKPAPPMTTPYLGRFGGSRLTPAPRFSSSSTTRAPLRDYHVYGIYPNKTIVRKRPEDNLIDARNVDSPYVIFGIFPDGRLVRKYPNGTVIPDPPSNPVEVVFTLRTTTTNRPVVPPIYNQANQAAFDRPPAPINNNNRIPDSGLADNGQGTVDPGLSANAISSGSGDLAPHGPPASLTTNQQTVSVYIFLISTTEGAATVASNYGAPVGPPSVAQGGRIVQDQQRDEATRTSEAGGQRSSVYIGQEKFVNYWNNGAANPPVHSVKLNSVASGINEGQRPSPVPSFKNLLSNQPGQVTAPPGFPWVDPLDQIFGITTNSPVISASVGSNTLDDSRETNQAIKAQPVNPFVEVFPPITSTLNSITNTIPPSESPTTMAETTIPPTIATQSARTTTTAASTTASTTTTVKSTTTSKATTTSSRITIPTGLPTDLPMSLQKQNPFGTSFDDLAFLNSLAPSNSISTTPKTLTEVEQLLANRILHLALGGTAGPTRSPKAIQANNASPNLVQGSNPSLSAPIVIELSPQFASSAPNVVRVTENPNKTHTTSKLSTPTTTSAPKQSPVTTTGIPTTTSAVTTTRATTTTAKPSTKKPVAKPATTKKPKPKTTVAPPRQGFGANLLQVLFGNNIFSPPTTPTAIINRQTPRSVITPKPTTVSKKPITTTAPVTTTEKVLQSTPVSHLAPLKTFETSTIVAQSSFPVPEVSKVLDITPRPIRDNVKSASTVSSSLASFTQTPATYSPEEDVKFLAALLNAAQQLGKCIQTKSTGVNGTPGSPSRDDEAFLRSILAGQARVKTPSTPTNQEPNEAALMAALLKAQGIEPSTPSNDIREQLRLASQGVTVATPRSPSSARPKTVTKRPTSSRPRPRTTTWSPSSTYPPPLFSSFSFGNSPRGPTDDSTGGGETVRNQVVNAAIGVTRAFGQFLGAAITGAARQLQSFVRNGTR
ncbi:mucin-2-like [Prorops nasuta]|uniref:mucin-2-like n=1 Tax=Prorops nasuta TaxID=863751 RepID=UPI0034CF0B23